MTEPDQRHRRYCDRILKAQEEFLQASPMGPDLIDVQADAAMAVADEEQQELRQERAEDAGVMRALRRQRDTAEKEITRLRAELGQARGTTGQGLRQQIAAAIHKAGAYCGECNFDDDSKTCPDCLRVRGWYVDAVLPVVQAAVAAGVRRALEDAANAIDAETRRCRDDGVLEPDKFRPCRDATEQLRARAAAVVSPAREQVPVCGDLQHRHTGPCEVYARKSGPARRQDGPA